MLSGDSNVADQWHSDRKFGAWSQIAWAHMTDMPFHDI